MFSKLKSATKAQLFVAALLIVHTVWICVHLSLVAHAQINPWKLGGYGMYTVPNPLAKMHVYLIDKASQSWVELRVGSFNSFEFDRRNHLNVFRCRPPSKRSIVGFLDENPHLRHRPLTIALSEQVFEEGTIDPTRTIYAKVEVGWADKTRFAYRGETCGTAFEGRGTYQAPT